MDVRFYERTHWGPLQYRSVTRGATLVIVEPTLSWFKIGTLCNAPLINS